MKFVLIRMNVSTGGFTVEFHSLYYIFLSLIIMQIYLLDIHIFYTIASAFFGFLLGARDRLGEVSVVTLLCLTDVKIKIYKYVTFLAFFIDKIFGSNSQTI